MIILEYNIIIIIFFESFFGFKKNDDFEKYEQKIDLKK